MLKALWRVAGSPGALLTNLLSSPPTPLLRLPLRGQAGWEESPAAARGSFFERSALLAQRAS
ncbi:MAG: hypothetical protein J2P37_25160, partial [Ktedonobacteraceae bacterium]|nr:hypothetical protein [Ktedonobacteraceae bacterium]